MRERGSLSAMAVCMVPSLFVVAALTIDGGRLVVAYQRVSEAASAASRIGAQEIAGIMEGDLHVYPPDAVDAAEREVHRLGYTGSARATRTFVEVTIEQSVSLPLLSIIGIGDRQVRVTRTSDAVVG